MEDKILGVAVEAAKCLDVSLDYIRNLSGKPTIRDSFLRSALVWVLFKVGYRTKDIGEFFNISSSIVSRAQKRFNLEYNKLADTNDYKKLLSNLVATNCGGVVGVTPVALDSDQRQRNKTVIQLEKEFKALNNKLNRNFSNQTKIEASYENVVSLVNKNTRESKELMKAVSDRMDEINRELRWLKLTL